jgi:hypothetical protein
MNGIGVKRRRQLPLTLCADDPTERKLGGGTQIGSLPALQQSSDPHRPQILVVLIEEAILPNRSVKHPGAGLLKSRETARRAKGRSPL